MQLRPSARLTESVPERMRCGGSDRFFSGRTGREIFAGHLAENLLIEENIVYTPGRDTELRARCSSRWPHFSVRSAAIADNLAIPPPKRTDPIVTSAQVLPC